MRLLILTEKIDKNDFSLGFFHEWLRRIALRCDRLDIVCTTLGPHTLPENVRIHQIRKNKGWHLAFIIDLFTVLIRQSGRYDAVFIHRTLAYAVFAGWWWRLFRKKMVLWFEYSSVTLPLRIATFFVNAIATSAPDALRIQSDNVHVIGQDLDMDYFSPPKDQHRNRTRSALHLLATGRITPSRRSAMIVEALAVLRQRGINADLTILGSPFSAEDKQYTAQVQNSIAAAGLSEHIHHISSVLYTELASYYQKSDLALFMPTSGGREKRSLECMACGTPVLVANPAYISVVGDALAKQLLFAGGTADELADRIIELEKRGTLDTLRPQVRERVTSLVPPLDTFIDKLLELCTI